MASDPLASRPPRNPMVRWWLLAAAVVAALVLAGCTTVPTSGPIVQGAPVGVVPDDQFIRVIARPPAPGMTPLEIVQGFLAASASAEDDHGVARQYLSVAADASWDPSVGVRVYEASGVQLEQPTPNTVSLTAGLSATIDADHALQVTDRGAQLDARFTVERVGGEWRITTVPAGLLLTRGDIERGFRTYDLYYLDPTFSILVPDPIMVPVSGSGVATLLAQSLLAGPSNWLAPAVRTAFPENTSLDIDAVTVQDGVARVALDPGVLTTDDATRRAMSAQFVWTLRQLPEVTAVELTVSGQPLPVAGVEDVTPVDQWQAFDPEGLPPGASGYAIAEGAVVTLGPDGALARVPGPLGIAAAQAQRVAVSLEGGRAAIVRGSASCVVSAPIAPVPDPIGGAGSGSPTPAGAASSPGPSRPSSPGPNSPGPSSTPTTSPTIPGATNPQSSSSAPGTADPCNLAGATTLIPAKGVTSLSYDRGGTLWAAVGGDVVRIGQDGSATPAVATVPIEGLENAEVLVVRIARDGTRAAILVQRRGRVVLLLTRVVQRQENVILSGPRRVESALADVDDVAWADDDSLAVLGTEASSVSAFSVELATGVVAALAGPGNPSAIAAAPDHPVIVAASAAAGGRSILSTLSDSWTQGAAAAAPAYPG